ncbi:endolytic transglycosylase MltG [Neobacillus sp. PS3-34]|uniref:endolytic transglycosylase MltG n=1 Tax=Neobacillus sp. PS3-34 TaxID=3070678 RepID=UPI0035A70B61
MIFDTIIKKLKELLNEEGKSKRKVMTIAAAIIIAAAVISGGGYMYFKSALKPVSPGSREQRTVEVPIGSSVSGIASTLEDKGIIKDAHVFKLYVKLNHEAGFMAGEYQLSPSMTVREIVKSLKTGKVFQKETVRVTIPEGKQLKEIALILSKAANKPETDVFKRLNDRNFIQSLIKEYPDVLSQDILSKNVIYPLEGYLFPATYPFYKEKPTVDEMVKVMLDKTQIVIEAYKGQMKQKNLKPHQLLTMASLIEEEATQKADRHKIASVFYNRIAKGMPLQTDPTVLYAQGKHKDRVFYKDLEVKSPYNTYKNSGLPPGPIANAGKMSIEAALNPEKTDFLYFLAASDGTVIFTKTLDEHNREKAKHISSKK